MTPDPVFDRLAKFTPDPAAVDTAELLFAAGRAATRTPWYWKAAVSGLLLANIVTVAFLLLRAPADTPAPRVLAVPVPIAEPQFESPATPSATDATWTYRTMLSDSDFDRLPKPEVVAGTSPDEQPLTPLSVRRGELD